MVEASAAELPNEQAAPASTGPAGAAVHAYDRVSLLFGSVTVAESGSAEPSLPAVFATRTSGGAFTSSVAVAVVWPPSSSVTVTTTFCVPAKSYVWLWSQPLVTMPSPHEIEQLWVSFEPASAIVVCADAEPCSGIIPGVTESVAVGSTLATVSVALATTSMLWLSLTVSSSVHIPLSLQVIVGASTLSSLNVQEAVELTPAPGVAVQW